jgi:hypothetical protein
VPSIAAVLVCLPLGSVNALDEAEPLRIHVSPPIAREPARLFVRVTVEAGSDGRYVQVVAESPDFYRSTEVPIDGPNRSRVKVFEFPNLPAGVYEVTGRLVGPRGTRTSATSLARIVP